MGAARSGTDCGLEFSVLASRLVLCSLSGSGSEEQSTAAEEKIERRWGK
jgi:hypothetical protein